MKKLFTSFAVLALLCCITTDANAQTPMYGRPIGALYCGVTETGSRLGGNQYLVVPAGVDVTFPNLSTEGSSYYWTYDNLVYRGDTIAHVDSQTEAAATATDLTMSIPDSAEGSFFELPVVYADASPFQLNVYKVKVQNGNYTNTDGSKTYWLCNHGLYGSTGAKARHYSQTYYCLNSETTNAKWLSKNSDDYTALTVKGFLEYFRKPLKKYKLSGVNVVVYSPTISSTGVKVEICKATSNDNGSMKSYTTSGAYATWTATSSDLTQIGSTKYYMLKFSGDAVEIDDAIAIKISPVNSEDTETTFTVSHTGNPQNLGASDQSAYLVCGVTKTDGSESTVRLSALTTNKYVIDNSGEEVTTYMRSFAVYINVEYVTDSSTDGIKNVGITEQKVIENDAVYNLQGQRVSPDTKGIVIKNGKKIVNR